MRKSKVHISLSALSLCLASAVAPITVLANINPSSSVQQECEALDEAVKQSVERQQAGVKEAYEFKDALEEREAAFDCQMTISSEMTTWVQGQIGGNPLIDKIIKNHTNNLSKEACDSIKSRLSEATKELQEIEKKAQQALTAYERAADFTEQATRPGGVGPQPPMRTPPYSYPGHLPTPTITPPRYSGPPTPTTGSSGADPWAAVRNIWGGAQQ